MNPRQDNFLKFEKIATHISTPDTSGFYVLDDKYDIVLWSKTAEKSTGIKEEDALGKNFFEISPDNSSTKRQIMKEVLEKKKPMSFLEFYQEGDAWLRKTVFPEKDHLFVMFRDISFDLQMEHELRNIQNLKRHVLNSFNDAIWAIDRDYKLLVGNNAYFERMRESTGRQKPLGESVLQDPLIEDQANRRRNMWKSAYDKALRGEANQIVISYASGGGDKKYFQADLSPITPPVNDEAGVVGVACFSRDITERRKNLLSIKEQNKNLSQIAWMNSHKVRAPLANILGLTDVLASHQNEDSEFCKVTSFLKQNAEELDKVLREISEKTYQKEQ